MSGDPEELRASAQEWGRALLLQAPWEPLTERLSLILVSPVGEPGFEDSPPGLEVAPPLARFWMLIDRASMRSLPDTIRQPLLESGAMIERHRATASTPEVELSVRGVEAVERQVEGTGPRDLELRWLLMHATAIGDRLRRLETLAARARLLPPDGLERAVRSLWLEAHASARALWPLAAAPGHALAPAGELAGALLRLACLLDEGAYPPAELLRSTAAETRIGLRIGGWLNDLLAALGDDDAAGRRAFSASEQVLEEVRQVLRERYADRPWLRDPATYELRARR